MDTNPSAQPFWSLSPHDVAKMLKTDLARGLTAKDAAARLHAYGSNEFGTVGSNTKLRIFLQQFKSPLIFILIIAGIATLFIEAWFDAAIIFLAIGVNASMGFFQEYKAENALAQLRSYIEVRTRVVRDGREREEDAREVVPGDIIHLTRGSRVPADARLVSAHDLEVDEAILTGESLPVEKHAGIVSADAPVAERKNMVFGGTLVTGGNGFGVVTATALSTEFGKIATLVSSTSSEETPMEEAIKKLAWIVTIGVSVLVAGIFALGLSRGEPFFDIFLVSIAVAVGAIPEALPIGLTAILAIGVERLAKRNGVMQSLAAVETLGSTTVVMTDKTGTLTEGHMELVGVLSTKYLLGRANAPSVRTARERFSSDFSSEQKELLSLAVLGTDVLIENPDDDPSDWRISGSPLEAHIIRSAALHGVIRAEHARERKFRTALPFSSTHKFSVSQGLLEAGMLGDSKKEGHTRVALGAPDVLLARSTQDEETRAALHEAVARASAEGKRLVGIAVSHGHEASGEGTRLAPEDVRDLEFVGVLAFVDPVRKEVPEAIARIEKHGVRVVMATGDLRGTAIAVARDMGWTVEDSEVCTGQELLRFSDEELTGMLDTIKVYARVTPEDKLRIAQLFKKRGEIVAMTGDGVNDAPSLKAVDIGIAVGSGTEVAKSVADLVLLDNNFNTIVSAIEEGKRVLQNIRKTFVYLASSSFDEVLLIGGSLLFGLPLPLSAIQIIWVNFFTESLPAIAFAFDHDADLIGHGRHADARILNKTVKSLTLGVGLLSSVLMFALYGGLLQFDLEEKTVQTFIFACFASYILFVAFSLRSLEKPIFSYNPFSNRLLNLGVLFGLFLLAATIYVPLLQNIFKTVPLGPVWLLGVAAWVVFNVLLVEATKWIFYRHRAGTTRVIQ